MRLLFRLSVFFGALFFITDCGTSNNSAISPTVSSLYTNVFQPNCVRCHSPGANTQGVMLDFSTIATSYSTLRSTVHDTSNPNCQSASIVSPGNTRNSYILAMFDPNYSALNYNLPTNCFPTTSHQATQNLSADEYSALMSWIAAGALND